MTRSQSRWSRRRCEQTTWMMFCGALAAMALDPLVRETRRATSAGLKTTSACQMRFCVRRLS